MSSYDSRPDTEVHIARVQELMGQLLVDLRYRADMHDASKLKTPERQMFDKYTPMLRALTYGSPEYEAVRQEMLQTALAHHYAHNSHHPEHYPNGIEGMSLLDVLEMLADWKAATERHADGNLSKSLEINAVRFGISPQLLAILANTVRDMEW